MNISKRLWAVLSAAAVVVLTACGSGDRTGAPSGNPGQAGQSFLVTVSRQPGGTVSSGADGRILCGTAAGATRCGPVAYAWGETVTLTATPDAGFMFGTWAGDCVGRQSNATGQYVCVLDTTRYGADKYVVPVFGEPGKTAHPNFTDPAVHGSEFLARIAKRADSFDCAYCHGAGFDGRGIAPSCNACHEKNGFPDWRSNCTFCHGAPPPSPPVGVHPAVSSAITDCAACHPESVDEAGRIVVGGKHMDGAVQASGGHGDWASPDLHGGKFFDYLGQQPGALTCTNCHGTDYDLAMNASGDSCTGCHYTAGWATWRTNCSFCHGEKNPISQLGGYDLQRNPMWAAPGTGAHQAHLANSGRFTAPFACATCHTVPDDLSHVDGFSARAVVTLAAAGRASLPANLGTYDPASATCTTYCHGNSASPAWSTTGLQCGGCHALPPPPSSGHPSGTFTLGDCVVCHPSTMSADGTLDVAGGAHLDGVVQFAGLHGDYSSPDVHGPKFFTFIAGGGGACRTCHGAADGGGVGPSCNACHQSAGWTQWQTNCSFCHGQKNVESQRGGYDLAAHPMWAAPDDGAHRSHLTGATRDGAVFAEPFRCETCHAVPTDLSHISGAAGRATVTLGGAGQASLPASLGSYVPEEGTCSTYCHGASPSPRWTASGLACNGCHALPPNDGKHPAVSGDLTRCTSCHSETLDASGRIEVANGKHIDGTVQGGGHPDYTQPATHGPKFFSFLSGTSSDNCQSCHGVAFEGGSGPSCNACHSSAGWSNWQTNCSFCHGKRDDVTKAGYDLAINPAWAAPPDSVQQRLGGAAEPARTGAHQAHLSGISQSGTRYAAAFKCETCHTVPGDLSHAGNTGRAPVVLSGSGQGSLPQDLGTYDAASGTCTTYCHGTTLAEASAPKMKPAWGGGAIQCGNCHGTPPLTGTGSDLSGCNGVGCHNYTSLHELHDGVVGDGCEGCHASTLYGWPYQMTGVHVNGSKDVRWSSATTGTWDDASGSCLVSCHGATKQWR